MGWESPPIKKRLPELLKTLDEWQENARFLDEAIHYCCIKQLIETYMERCYLKEENTDNQGEENNG